LASCDSFFQTLVLAEGAEEFVGLLVTEQERLHPINDAFLHNLRRDNTWGEPLPVGKDWGVEERGEAAGAATPVLVRNKGSNEACYPSLTPVQSTIETIRYACCAVVAANSPTRYCQTCGME
jgi:hypothetical protein